MFALFLLGAFQDVVLLDYGDCAIDEGVRDLGPDPVHAVDYC